MVYFVVDNFKAGVDTRTPVFAAEPGTLTVGQDVHLSSGGNIEKRKAFVPYATLPAGTFGLAQKLSTIYVFGSIPDPGGFPAGFAYQRLVHPAAAAMTDMLDVEMFSGNFYNIAAYGSDVVHFYNGARVTDWLIAGEVDADAFTGGRAAKTLGEKMYAISGPNLNFSMVGDPTKFKVDVANTGAGFINLSIHSAGSEELVGCELYYDSLAVFSRENVQLWHLTADPTTNSRIQTLRGAGLIAPRATISYLDGDNYFISYQGVKAISPRDRTSGRSLINDASAPVDKELVAHQQGLSPGVLANALMLQEPEYNRLWVIMGDRIYVLSVFPARNIKAWTEYRPGFVIDAAIVCDRRVYVRSGNQVYLYGGPGNDVYFEGTAIVRLPFVTSRAPATFKGLNAFDAGVEGTWEVLVSVDPDPDAAASYERVGIITGQTYTEPTYPIVGSTTHVSVEFRHTGPEAATLSSLALHYKTQESG